MKNIWFKRNLKNNSKPHEPTFRSLHNQKSDGSRDFNCFRFLATEFLQLKQDEPEMFELTMSNSYAWCSFKKKRNRSNALPPFDDNKPTNRVENFQVSFAIFFSVALMESEWSWGRLQKTADNCQSFEPYYVESARSKDVNVFNETGLKDYSQVISGEWQKFSHTFFCMCELSFQIIENNER